MSFRGPSGRILEAFWGHVELRNRLGSSLRALFVLEVDFFTSTHPILEGFGDLLEKISKIFSKLLSV